MEWEGERLAQNQGWFKIRYEKGLGLPMLPKNRVGRVSEKLKRTMKKGLGASWFHEWGGKGLGRPKIKHEKGGAS